MYKRQYLMADSIDKTTHFGSQTIPEAEKAGRVRGVFNSVASKYDVMNDAMSFGIHRIWKARAGVKSCWMWPGARATLRFGFSNVRVRVTPPC